ncbi:AlpA family phage regulatory protein [Variovorax paradoxus]|uniref:helix-turn-helix transcriptional regulator n=1 Tax=Variovorax paradoxus TaxID=34073 RepID=UPI00247A74A1
MNQRPQALTNSFDVPVEFARPKWRPKNPKRRLMSPEATEPAQHIPRYVRLPELRRMVLLSPATIWRKARNGSFPPAIKLSERVTAWNRRDVEAWLDEREAA